MLWIIYALDNDGTADLRAAGHAEHLAYLEAHVDKVFFSGGLLNDEGKRYGSCFIINVRTREAAEAWMASEPYNKSGLYRPLTISHVRKGQINMDALPLTAEGE